LLCRLIDCLCTESFLQWFYIIEFKFNKFKTLTPLNTHCTAEQYPLADLFFYLNIIILLRYSQYIYTYKYNFQSTLQDIIHYFLSLHTTSLMVITILYTACFVVSIMPCRSFCGHLLHFLSVYIQLYFNTTFCL